MNLSPEGARLRAALSPVMFSLMDELSQVMFCAKDITGHYVAVNQVFVARTCERSRSAVIGRTATDLFVPQLAERYERQDIEVFRTGLPLRGELERIRRPGGASGWYLTAKYPVFDAGSVPSLADAGRTSPAAVPLGLVSVSQDLRLGEADDNTMASLSALIAAVEADLSARWTIEEMARVAGCSGSVLDRRVRRVFGFTPRQLVLRSRVDRAISLLRDATLPLAEVATEAGFYDQPSFTRQFARMTGETPSLYRQRTRHSQHLA